MFTEIVAQIIIQKGKLRIKFETKPYCTLLFGYQVTQRHKSCERVICCVVLCIKQIFVFTEYGLKVKQSRYRPGVAQRVAGS